MEIGTPQKTITIAPLYEPIPQRRPVEEPEREVVVPERERVAVPV